MISYIYIVSVHICIYTYIVDGISICFTTDIYVYIMYVVVKQENSVYYGNYVSFPELVNNRNASIVDL